VTTESEAERRRREKEAADQAAKDLLKEKNS